MNVTTPTVELDLGPSFIVNSENCRTMLCNSDHKYLQELERLQKKFHEEDDNHKSIYSIKFFFSDINMLLAIHVVFLESLK